MKRAIRQWMGGQDYHDPSDPVCSSHKGVLSYRGVPVGLCYYSYVTGRRHQIISDDADPRVRRFLKNREYVSHPSIMSVIEAVNANPRALSPVGTDALVLRHIQTVNTLMKVIGSPRPFREGGEFIQSKNDEKFTPPQSSNPWASTNRPVDVVAELTLLLYKLQKEGAEPFPYLVKARHKTDAETMRTTETFRDLGSEWFGTRSLMEFTLFKIGRINSLPLEIVYA